MKNLVNIFKNEIEDWKYQKFLLKTSGKTTVILYNDLKVLIDDDFKHENYIETICAIYNAPDFVVERLIQQARRYHLKTLNK